jgi:hypothetical protein
VLKAKELLESGAIGKPYFVQANYWESFGQATFLDDLEEQMEAGGNWRFQPELSGGGVMIDGATHWVRPMRIWYVNTSCGDYLTKNLDDTAYSILCVIIIISPRESYLWSLFYTKNTPLVLSDSIHQF